MWIYGEDGLGKTPLTISLMNDLTDRVERSSKRRALTYSFCQPSSGPAKNATEIVRELLYQLISVQTNDCSDPFEPFLEAYARYKHALLTQDHLSDLWLVLLLTLQVARIKVAYLLLYRPEDSDSNLLDSFPVMIKESWRTQCYMKWIVISRFDPANYQKINASHQIDLSSLAVSQPTSSEPKASDKSTSDGDSKVGPIAGDRLPGPAIHADSHIVVTV